MPVLANLQAGLLVYAEVMALGVAYSVRLLANYYAVVQVHSDTWKPHCGRRVLTLCNVEMGNTYLPP